MSPPSKTPVNGELSDLTTMISSTSSAVCVSNYPKLKFGIFFFDFNNLNFLYLNLLGFVIVAEKRNDLLMPESEKFDVIIDRVEKLHKQGTPFTL